MTINEKKLKTLKDDSSPDLSPAIVMDKIHMSEWLLLATLYKPEAEVLTVAERGTAAHTVMQFIAFDRTGSVQDIENEIMRLQKEKYIMQEEAESISPESVFRFFSSQLGKQLLAAPSCHREYSFAFLPPREDDAQEKTLIRGIIDCWFESDDGGITVLDFKTDRDPDPDIYNEQITSYTLALEAMLNRPASRRLLYFFSGGRVFVQEKDEEDGRIWQPAPELQ